MNLPAILERISFDLIAWVTPRRARSLRYGGMCLVALTSLPSYATTPTRDFLGGYLTSDGLFPNAGTLGDWVCGGVGGTVDGTWYRAGSNPDHQDVNFQCAFSNGVKSRSEYYYHWEVACPGSGVRAATEAGFPNGCTYANNKPPQTCPSSDYGHPINFLTKAKVRRETDYDGPQGLTFTRLYTSIPYPLTGHEVTVNWRHNFSKSLTNQPNSNAAPVQRYVFISSAQDWFPHPVSAASIWLNLPDGTALYFRRSSTEGELQYFVTDPDVKYSLTGTLAADGSIREYALRTPSDDIEHYNAAGSLSSISFKSGRSQSFSYSTPSTPITIAPYSNLLIGVSDNLGRELHFTYDNNGRMTSMVDPAGQVFGYAFDTNGNLVSVTYPDGLRRIYHYNETAYNGGSSSAKNSMTGISDEVSPGVIVRYGIFKYNAVGYAISTELAGGVDKFVFSYDYPVGITDSFGAFRQYGYTSVNGVNLQTNASQPAGAGCYGSSASMTYDSNGNMSTKRDFNGVATTYTYDLSRNLEKTRVEASGLPEARTITTEWHPTMRLPLRVAEPKRITTYTYDANGNQTSVSVQATLDANGSQGMAAVRTGVPRTWSATYNSIGQVLTSTGPRTDVQETTSYAYDAATGNLLSVTNPAGQVTNYSNYDAHGRPGLIGAPNGISTELSYTVRGWLASTRVTAGGLSQLSQYEYDGVGHLKRFTAPDGTATNYSYDAAERLVGISDSLGNSISYTLDAMGNRTAENVSDPGGSLSRRITRTYDVLNRLQQQTGGAQ